MLYYSFKPKYISRSIENFEKRIDKFNNAKKQLEFMSEYVYKNSKGLRSHTRFLLSERNKYLKYVVPSSRFKIYTKNSIIPEYILGKILLVHRGMGFHHLKFKNPIVLGTKIGSYVFTKHMGENVHKNNKIAQKLIKKKAVACFDYATSSS